MKNDDRPLRIREGFAPSDTTVSKLTERLHGLTSMPAIWVITKEEFTGKDMEVHVSDHPLFKDICKRLLSVTPPPPSTQAAGQLPPSPPPDMAREPSATVPVRPEGRPEAQSAAPSHPPVSEPSRPVLGEDPVTPPLPRVENDLEDAFPGPIPDGYQYLGLVGRGAQGAVYKMRHLVMQDLRAIKILLEQRANAPAYRFFQKEIETLTKLKHNNIVRIYDARMTATYWFIAMEYVEGKNLRQILDERKRLSSRDAVTVMRQVVEAIDYAHSRDIIHRDLKPSNIMVEASSAWQVRVVDFGIATILQSAPDKKHAEELSLGTPGYRAPEKIATRQSDLYSLGVILYELLAGERPATPPLPLKEVRQDLDLRLCALADSLLEGDLTRRPASASEVLKVLQAVEASNLEFPSEVTEPRPYAPPPATSEVPTTSQQTRPSGMTDTVRPTQRRKPPSGHHDINVLEEKLRRTIEDEHLPLPFRLPGTNPAGYARLFEFVTTGEEASVAPRKTSLLDRTTTALERFKEQSPYRIDGAPGTGKTAFLATLYWHLRERRNKDPAAAIPIFINLSIYDARVSKSPTQGKQLTTELLKKELKKDLGPFITLAQLRTEQKFIIIIDHFDEYGRPRQELGVEARHLCATNARNISMLISSRKEAKRPSYSTSISLASFKGISPLSPRFGEFVLQYAEQHRIDSTGVVSYVEELARKFKLTEINFRLLWMLLAARRHTLQPERLSLSNIYDWECSTRLEENGLASQLEPLAELAFRHEIVREDISVEELHSNPVLWRLLHDAHPTTRDFLVATHIVGALMQAAKDGGLSSDKRKALSYLYPWTITRFCKELATATVKRQEVLLRAAEKIFKGEPSYAHALSAFLLGRVSHQDKDVRISARKLLEGHKHTLAARNDIDPTLKKLIEKTIATSLIVLGPQPQSSGSPWQASHAYIEKLLRDPEADTLERAFHLEYYGDAQFTATQHFTIRDDLQECPNTFEKLYQRIEEAIQREKYLPLFELELYTLCSLAQHRHAANCLKAPDREKIGGLVNQVLLREEQTLKFVSPSLKAYLRMIKRSFERDTFSFGAVLEVLFRLKTQQRQGWGLQETGLRVESVAEHMYGAFLLAWVCLPETGTEVGYSKKTILEILLLHDLSEAITGDKEPGEKTDGDKKNARRWIDYLSMLGTHNELVGLGTLKAAWSTFADREGINGKVAKEFDLLDRLLQLYIYRKSGHDKIPNDEKMIRKINDEVESPYGRPVLKLITRYFMDNQAPLDTNEPP